MGEGRARHRPAHLSLGQRAAAAIARTSKAQARRRPGSFPCPECPYGLADMAGNVWEWTRSPYQPYPYDESDDRANLDADALWVMRGGHFGDPARLVRTTARGAAEPGARRRSSASASRSSGRSRPRRGWRVRCRCALFHASAELAPPRADCRRMRNAFLVGSGLTLAIVAAVAVVWPPVLWSLVLIVPLMLRGRRRHAADAAGRAPQLPAHRARPLPARADPARDQPVLRREQQRRPARSAATTARSSTSAPRANSTRCPSAPSATSTPPATSGSTTRWRRSNPITTCARVVVGGARLHAAVFGVDLQRLGDELRLAQQERGARAQRRREAGRLRAQHGRRRPEPVPPRAWRRPGLADRHRLLRLPHARRPLRPRRVRARAPCCRT